MIQGLKCFSSHFQSGPNTGNHSHKDTDPVTHRDGWCLRGTKSAKQHPEEFKRVEKGMGQAGLAAGRGFECDNEHRGRRAAIRLKLTHLASLSNSSTT